jgi:two-component system, sensor histidine kinase and response regulator
VNVLIAEDDAMMRLMLQRAVEHQGHACLMAQDGLEAWQLFQTHTVDIVISDWLMPFMDGIELCRRVRQQMDRVVGYTYVIFLTALHDKEHMRTAMREGADDYLSKPLDPTELWTRLRVAARVMSLYRRVAAHQAELERSNAELTQFASTVSHDLQSPLSSIAGFSQLLQEHSADHLDAKATRYITGITDGVKRMHALIKDVLAYAQVGAQAPPADPIDCAVVVERAVADLHATIEERGALVTYGELPTVTADATQLSRVFQNLIGNAIKYCRETPRVAVSAQREGAEWLFCVHDNGIGMEAADAERIFDLFQRAHSAPEYPGTGIGLAICKKTIERHGGRIWTESCVGQGTTFKFTLPAREAPARDAG